jgi:hypothetical protein
MKILRKDVQIIRVIGEGVKIKIEGSVHVFELFEHAVTVRKNNYSSSCVLQDGTIYFHDKEGKLLSRDKFFEYSSRER